MEEKIEISFRQIAENFNEWLRLYEEAPQEFSSLYADIKVFLEDVKNEVDIPEYGLKQAKFFLELHNKLNG